MPAPLGPRRRLAYALGACGFQITDRVVVLVGIYYYLPPEETDLVPQLPGEVFLGLLTAYGLARLVGGVVDSLADPIVGFASDRSRSRLGRRRAFLLAGVGPMVLAPAALFFPPGAPGSAATFAFLTATLALYYVAFTVYVGPYLALIPEIARSQEERVSLSTLVAVAGFPAMGLYPAAWPAGLDALRSAGLPGETALRAVVLASCALALALCAAPILAVDERRLARGGTNTLPLGAALRTTLRNRPFLLYLAAQILFLFGINLVAPLPPYLAVVVLGRDEGFAGLLALLTAGPAVAGFFLVRGIARRAGPKPTLVASALLLAAVMGALGLLRPDAPGGPDDAWNLAVACTAMALAGVPVAAFLVLPHVLISELVDRDEVHTGAQRAAMYFGVQGLLTKWVYAASAAALSYLFATYGKSRTEPEGVLLVGPLAAAFCALAAGLYALYPEARVRREARGDAEASALAGKGGA